MKTLFTIAVGANLLAAFLISALTNHARQMEEIRERLDRSESELRGTLRELHRLRRESREAAERRDADLTARLERIETRTRGEALGIVRALTRDVEALYHDVLHPSVQVTGPGGVGGGTILYSRRGNTYVISAYHVIQKDSRPRGSEEAPGATEAIRVKLYDDRGAPADTVEGILAAFDERKDLALLKLRSDRTWTNVARLAPRERLREIKVFTPVYAVGCPLGHDPLPTLGEVATLKKEVGGECFWMMNAPTIFGNSGGGIFHRETRELIGVSVMICTYDGVISTPVPHLGILVSLGTVYDWLDSLGLRFLYDPNAETPDPCGAVPDEDGEEIPTAVPPRPRADAYDPAGLFPVEFPPERTKINP